MSTQKSSTVKEQLTILPSFKYGQGMFIKHSLQEKQLLKELAASKSNAAMSIEGDSNCFSLQDFSEFSKEQQKNLREQLPNTATQLYQKQLDGQNIKIITLHKSTTNPLRVEVVSSKENSYPTIVYLLSQGVSATIFERFNSQQGSIQSTVSLLIAQDNASCQWATICTGDQESNQLRLQQVICKKDAKVDCFDLHSSQGLVHVTQQFFLQEKGSSCNAVAAQLAKGKSKMLLAATMQHQSPYTNASMRSRSIVNDSAKTASLGTINIAVNAKSTHSTQESKGLLLSPKAQCDALPVLEVFTEEVSCSHAATISQCDEEELFYLESRGMDREEASQIIVDGFCRSLFEGIKEEQFLKQLDESITEVLL